MPHRPGPGTRGAERRSRRRPRRAQASRSFRPGGADSECRRLGRYLQVLDTELARGRVDVAVRVWHDAHGAALERRSWEGMIAVGDAFMRIGHPPGPPGGARMNARDAYLIALIRARRSGSVDGALRSAEAFRELGDGLIVEQCLHIAAQLAAGDDQARQRVHEARQRWAPSPIAES